jgi:ribosomal protein S18 acetylase RimI-like enzyme
MNINKIVMAEIVKMQITDINPILEILTENRLEVWRYNDFLSATQCSDYFALVAKIKSAIVGFCVARLIRANTNASDININSNKSSNSVNTENFPTANRVTDSINPESKISTGSENLKAECEIYNIAVKREFQNRGIGNRLLNELVLLIKQCNSQSIWLEVRNSNSKAINFYKKNDFGKIYERKNFYSNPVENAIVMKRDL